jgi:hypothetical protein
MGHVEQPRHGGSAMNVHITWQTLMTLEPRILGNYENDARSIGQREAWPWYERWLPGFPALRKDCESIARRHKLDYEEVYQVVKWSLVRAYKHERQGVR